MKTTTETYMRVLPRDLFNEAKLLKCVGRLCLLIHDNAGLPANIDFDHDGSPFVIEQSEDDGSLSVDNIKFKVEDVKYRFKSSYNSKANYPFYLQTDDYEDIEVFSEDGNFSPDFVTFCNGLKRPVIEVNNMGNFEFWLGCFRPRTKKWMREQLRLLKSGIGLLGTDPETPDKIKALKFLLK